MFTFISVQPSRRAGWSIPTGEHQSRTFRSESTVRESALGIAANYGLKQRTHFFYRNRLSREWSCFTIARGQNTSFEKVGSFFHSRGKPRLAAHYFLKSALSVETGSEQPPKRLDETLEKLCSSISTAISEGHERLRCVVGLPGVNQQLESTVPYSETLLQNISYGVANRLALNEELGLEDGSVEVRLVFSSTGRAHLAQRYFQDSKNGGTGSENPTEILCFGQESPHAIWSANELESKRGKRWIGLMIFIEPRNLRGDSALLCIEEMVEQQTKVLAHLHGKGLDPTSKVIWLLLNPYLEDQADNVAISIREIDRRRRFFYSFHICFFLEPVIQILRPDLIAVEHGVLIRSYNEDWKIFACQATRLQPATWHRAIEERAKISYSLAGTIDFDSHENRPPDGDEIMKMIRKERHKNQETEAHMLDSGGHVYVGILAALLLLAFLIIGEHKTGIQGLFQRS
jgi:hypothetical protein